MHHIDRTLQELEMNSAINGEYENEYEFSGNGEFGQAFEQSFGQEANYGNNETFEMGQDPELEMAYQLMEVSNEYELNQFLGNLMNNAVGSVKTAASNFVNSPTGQGIGQYLVKLGRKTLPQLVEKAGGLAINYGGFKGVPRPGPDATQAAQMAAGYYVGSPVGNFIANQAERIFGLPKKSSGQNQELEIARSFVRFATDLSRQANQITRQNPGISLGDLGKQAITTSARQYAPGLITGGQGAASGFMNGSANSGTWVRQGNSLIVYGV